LKKKKKKGCAFAVANANVSTINKEINEANWNNRKNQIRSNQRRLARFAGRTGFLPGSLSEDHPPGASCCGKLERECQVIRIPRDESERSAKELGISNNLRTDVSHLAGPLVSTLERRWLRGTKQGKAAASFFAGCAAYAAIGGAK